MEKRDTIFLNRRDAGEQLARELKNIAVKDGVVMAIPRGGVVVGAEVARELKLPLDLIIPRKVGAPNNPEVALGAVTQDGTAIFNQDLLVFLGLKEKDLSHLVKKQIEEIHRRMACYRGKAEYPEYDGRQIILVDDGIATGYTVLAALRSIRKMFQPRELILAVPVMPHDIMDSMEREVDRVIALLVPVDFQAVGQYYLDFSQTTDEEVIELLKKQAAIGS